MNDKQHCYTFEYFDSKNDLRQILKVDVTNLAKNETEGKHQTMDLFQTNLTVIYKGKKYTKEEFGRFVRTPDFNLENDFSFGGMFNFFCANIGSVIQHMAISSKPNNQIN
jgi:hypothetical protein